MPGHPFARLTRKARLQARLLGLRRSLRHPFRPDRLRTDRPGPGNLLLVGIDTLRADHLGCHGYGGGPVSPHLDRLAGGGTLFLDATSAAPWTLPSFSSALTGVMPGLHGGFLTGEIRNMDTQPPHRLNPEIVTLAAHLRRQGYTTAAFYSNQFFAFGLAESFDEHHYHNLAAEDLAAVAREWIRTHADGPFFCFILFNDPHEPTTPRAEDLAPFWPRAKNQGASDDPAFLEGMARWGEEPHLGRMANPTAPENAAVLAAKLAIYDATIHQVDRAIGDLQAQLESWGLAGSTLVSVFSDHGEEFLDHAEFSRFWDHDPRPIHGIGHGHTQFQELLHVPWLAWGPGVPAGVRRREPVSLCDLAPTLLEWLGLPPLEQPSLVGRLSKAAAEMTPLLVGHSQAYPAAPDGGMERTLLAEAIAFGPDLVMVRRGRWKLIATRAGRVLALFDLLGGPEESQDVQEENPGMVAELTRVLTSWRESGTGAGGEGAAEGTWDDMDDEIRQRLRDLGYSD